MAAPAAVSGRKGTQPLGQFQGVSVALAHSVPRQMDWNRQLPRRPRPSEVHKHCSSPYGSLLSHAEKLHRCAADHPRPHVVSGMVVSGAAGVRLLRVGGCAWSGAVYMSRPLWALGVQSGSVTCSGGLFGLVSRPLRAAKRAAHSSRSSWVVLPWRRSFQRD